MLDELEFEKGVFCMKNLIALVLIMVCIFGLTGCNKSQTNDGETIDIVKLQEKYPQFFNISTDGGFIVYIWQESKDDYRCYLVNKNLEAVIDRTFEFEVGATIAEMRAILSTYEVGKEDIEIKPIINPLSSYNYEIDDAYRENVKELFWQDYN